MISEQEDAIANLDAAIENLPQTTSGRDRAAHAAGLAQAKERLTQLKKQKRQPGTLLTLADTLRKLQHDANVEPAEDMEQLHRLRRQPTGSEDILAGLEAERTRLKATYGSVEAYFKLQSKQRKKALKDRELSADGFDNTRALVAKVVKSYPDFSPRDLLPHVQSAIEDSGKQPITDKWARELIRLARGAKTTKRNVV